MHVRPCHVFGRPASGLQGVFHRLDGAFGVAVELAGVGHPGERGEVWPVVDHLLVGVYRIVVHAQFDLGVAHDTVVAGALRVGGQCPCSVPQRRREVVAREGEGPPGGEEFRGLGLELLGLVQQSFRPGVQGRVARLPHLLEVGVGQFDVRVEVFGVLPDLLLEGADQAVRRSACCLAEIER